MRNLTDGLIRSTTNEGVEAGDDASILNEGTIEAFDDAIQVGENALITNSGTIENTQELADIVPGVEAQDAIDIDSGSIINNGTGVIKSTTNAAIDYDAGAADPTITNRGTISGTVAVNTDDADTRGQAISNYGSLVGTSGLALNLGDGDDTLEMFEGGSVTGGVDLGADDDRLIFDVDFVFSMDFALGALMDGGDGQDSLIFENLLLSDLSRGGTNGDAIDFLIGGQHRLNTKSFENFIFSDNSSFTFAEVASATSPVPLPAPILFLATGIAGFAALRRRRRTA